MQDQQPDFSLEALAMKRRFRIIAGVDEVGRGPLAGPVTAAAVILDPERIPDGMNDSKKLTHSRRIALAGEIHAVARVSIAHASVEEIDRLNILRAAHLAMLRALEGLGVKPDLALIDGNMLPDGLPCDGENSSPAMDGKQTTVTAQRSISRRCEILGLPHIIDVLSSRSTTSCIKKNL